jgi:hypothetical protein
LSYYFGFSFVQIYTSKGQDIEEFIQKVSESNLNVKYYALIIKELKRLLKATFNENLNEFLCAKNKRLRNRQGVQEIFHKYLDPFSFSTNLQVLSINAILHYHFYFERTVIQTSEKFNISKTTMYKILDNSLIDLNPDYLDYLDSLDE